MIVRTLKETLHSDRDIQTKHWASRRLILKKDGMGFSLHETTVYAGANLKMCYLNHLEAVYCTEGRGEILNLQEDKTHPISKGTLYALNNHDPHILKAFTDMTFVCVFNPPLVGSEVHNQEGAYEIEEEAS